VTASDDQDSYRLEVVRRIRAAVGTGASDLISVLARCEGADPVFVRELYEKEFPTRPLTAMSTSHIRIDPADPRISLRLPAPDPATCQWWFTSNAIGSISELVEARSSLFSNRRILCLGTPSLAYYLGHRGNIVDALDIDPDVVAALSPLPEKCSKRVYDSADPLPCEFISSVGIAIVDPPWYEAAMRSFLCRALEAAEPGGEVILTFPPRLTRPGIEAARATLLDDLMKAGHQILALERNHVRYLVPRFELAALTRRGSFAAIPWRAGDLLHIRKGSGKLSNPLPLPKSTARSFSRNPLEYRIFMKGSATLSPDVATYLLEKYSSNISTRAHPGEDPDIWSTEKVGLHIGRLDTVLAALETWQDLRTDEKAALDAVSEINGHAYSRDLISRLDEDLELWARFADPPPLRTDDEIETIKARGLTNWATKPSQRERADPTDTFRGSFQRVRDRVLWSSALRRLSNKTQLFPYTYDDQLRQRLTHSIEVSQLATTIGASFGLDRDLIEAGALAHDIGHTPFGHAGEHALHKLFNEIDKKLGGFNHYEHGVDVVRWLEGPYYVSDAIQCFGLNLTPEVLECILKHTYCQTKDEFSTEELLRRSKHTTLIPKGFCHLEGQAVRIADKISYLISDLEDGIRLGILSEIDLQSCQFFHRPPIDLIGSGSGPLYERFLSQRRLVLKILMEDVLHATSRRLSRSSSKNARNETDFLVNHSEEMQIDVAEIWSKLQAGRLHLDRVIAANLAAARTVAELTLAFALLPELVERRFREEHERLWNSEYARFYDSLAGKSVRIRKELISFLPMYTLIGKAVNITSDPDIPIMHLIMAKDYVSGLSDSRARAFHTDLFAGTGIS
jgi:dGTPase